MAVRLGNLKQGEMVRLKFHGSKQLGNSSYILQATFNRYSGSQEDLHALFNFRTESFDVYRYNGKWSYGTSAERVTIAK